MWALTVAIIYFGTFLVLGCIAKVVLDKLMDRTGAGLSDVLEQTAGRARSSSWVRGALRIEAAVLATGEAETQEKSQHPACMRFTA